MIKNLEKNYKISHSKNIDYEAVNRLLYLSNEEKEYLKKIKNSERTKEFLGVRYLLQDLLKINNYKYLGLEKNLLGAPKNIANKNLFVSLSHSDGILAAAFSEKKIGIDIQKINQKTLSITKRFFNESDNNSILENEIKNANLVWSIKESAYKVFSLENFKIPSLKDIFIKNDKNLQAAYRNLIASINYKIAESYVFSIASR